MIDLFRIHTTDHKTIVSQGSGVDESIHLLCSIHSGLDLNLYCFATRCAIAGKVYCQWMLYNNMIMIYIIISCCHYWNSSVTVKLFKVYLLILCSNEIILFQMYFKLILNNCMFAQLLKLFVHDILMITKGIGYLIINSARHSIKMHHYIYCI